MTEDQEIQRQMRAASVRVLRARAAGRRDEQKAALEDFRALARQLRDRQAVRSLGQS